MTSESEGRAGDTMTKQDEHFAREVEHWTSKVAEYKDKLRHAETKLAEARTVLAPFKVGQEVEYYKRGEWVPAIVRAVEPQSWGTVSFSVSLRKKNGEWMDRVEKTYSAMGIR